MTSEDDRFLKQILAQPSSDAPRLEYARWLAGQGDSPRARFMEVQCRIAQLLEKADPDIFRLSRAELKEHQELHAEERELLRQWGDFWDEPLKEKLSGLQKVIYRKGVPHHLVFFARDFARRGNVSIPVHVDAITRSHGNGVK